MSDSSSGAVHRWLPWSVLVAATLLLVGSAAYVGSSLGQSLLSPGTVEVAPSVGFPSDAPSVAPARGGAATAGMMRTKLWLAGNGTPVTTIAAARTRAATAATPSGLHPGEVMQFSAGFYVALKDAAGRPAAEVLVDPATGAVFTEYGPAAMWTSSATPYAVSLERATAIASAWLQANAPGQGVGSAALFPGHYTMHTVSGGRTAGMLSVNATTGAVWYHTWQGTFIAQEDG